MMKKLLSVVSLTLLSLVLATPSEARDIPVKFAKGSYCGSYSGQVKVGDNFVLSLGKEHQLIIQKKTDHDYAVIAPNGKYLEVIQRFPDNKLQYWTGEQSGKFKVRVNSVPQAMQIDIQFCAYRGEGEL